MDLTTLTITDAAEMIGRRALSPLELTRAFLARISALDPQINSFITVTAEQALADAQEAEQAIQRGEYRGPLHGIPIALKDLFETKGVLTTAGSKHLATNVPVEDGVVVQKLKEAGAILLGKLNMHEWAMSVTNDNPHYGPCRNPWDLERIPGGSSGGSGAAVAATLCLGALGSDTGGSIRIPAALCGVVGLKPTYGRVSKRGVLPLSWNLDHIGPLAARVQDAGLLFQAIAGYDAQDSYSLDVATKDYLGQIERGVRGWRVAVAYSDFTPAGKQADEEVLQAVWEAVSLFEQLGATVSEVSWPQAQEATKSALCMIVSDAAVYHQERLAEAEQTEAFGEDVRASLQRGMAYSAPEYARARRAQVLLRHHFEEFFTHHDILLTPVTPTAAPLRIEPPENKGRASLVSYTAPFNLTGLPALSLPCGFTESGLPIGLQLVARPWAEDQLLRAAYAYEQATTWHERKPPLQI
ncbi:MAG: Asp-tRNA(Asn)/Glu-tRNA(Gln) amidotransferase subunit GatA [Ardenticatenales bacterium]|nr:Asp-tRNA(Asn)/Glu-tRNA(Gln) amidotransferase subunit GatA [Ardenticatenales bacterium]